MNRLQKTLLVSTALLLLLGGCAKETTATKEEEANKQAAAKEQVKKEQKEKENQPVLNKTGVKTLKDPSSITALVNKHNKFPDKYTPNDLVYPDVPFVFGSEKVERSMLRKEAAQHLETMFAEAKKENIHLSGVSAFRSYETQIAIFDGYVQQDGKAAALTYSALPGTSEHQSGLAIDISNAAGEFAAEQGFETTAEGKWLAANSYKYGYILRFPDGKEAITGYEYESWHFRYIGVDLAKKVFDSNLTYEKYADKHPEGILQ
ncbi:M15 family metallopeptidase [Brochothrix thermosphacta]|uniref:M15 family metallopeptidase n=1 Tax=Brochothrix thermosphacta TaxID=2756 RepID=UPI001F07A339|nr:M15 family metallopeptidase [Brochothrix thermosphacta]